MTPFRWWSPRCSALPDKTSIIHAGAPCPPDVKQAMIDWWGPILVEYYGAAEGHGSTVITSSEWLEKRGSAGQAAVGVIHICDDDGNVLPSGAHGTIYFERDTAPFEYHNDPEKTAAARHPITKTGQRSVISDTSMTTATCISPTESRS